VVKHGADTKELGLTFNGPIIVGKFVDRERPTWLDVLSRFNVMAGVTPERVPNVVAAAAKPAGFPGERTTRGGVGTSLSHNIDEILRVEPGRAFAVTNLPTMMGPLKVRPVPWCQRRA